MADLLQFVAASIWGGNIIAVKFGLKSVAPLDFIAIRFSLASLILGITLFISEGLPHLSKRDWALMFIAGTIGISAYQVAFTFCVKYTSASTASLFCAISPMVSAVYRRVVNNEKLLAFNYLGIMLAFAGVFGILYQGAGTLRSLKGDIAGVIAAILWAVYANLSSPLLQRHSSLLVTSLTTITGSLIVIFLALVLPLPTSLGSNVILSLLYSAIISTALTSFLWQKGIDKIGAVKTLLYQNIVPLVATILGVFFLKERLTRKEIIDGVVLLLGVFLSRINGLPFSKKFSKIF